MIEQYHTLPEAAEKMHISREKARQIFMEEPGVVKMEAGKKKGPGKRRMMYRIPESVIERVLRRSANPAKVA